MSGPGRLPGAVLVVVILYAGFRGHDRKGTDPPALVVFELLDDVGPGQAVADTQARQAHDLGEGAGHDDVLVVQDQRRRADAVRRIPGELDVGLVHEDHDVGWNAAHELLEVVEGRDDAGGIARRGNDDDPRVLGNGRLHGVEVLVEIGGRADQARPGAVITGRPDHAAVTGRRLDHLAAVAQVGRRDGEEHLGRTATEGDPRFGAFTGVPGGYDDRQPVPFRDLAVESAAPVVAIELVDVLHDGLDGAGRRTDRVFVAAQPDQPFGHAPAADRTCARSCHHLRHGLVAAQGSRPGPDRKSLEKLAPREPRRPQGHRLDHVRHNTIL